MRSRPASLATRIAAARGPQRARRRTGRVLLIGLLAFGTTLLAPMWMALLGAVVGLAVRKGRLQLIRRALRSQLRAAR